MSAPLGFVGSLCGGRWPLSIRRRLVVDDGVTALYDPFDDDDRLRVTAAALSGPGWILPAPAAVRRADRSDARDPLVASWTSRPPTDRAPPRV
jgi:hypothetical protein